MANEAPQHPPPSKPAAERPTLTIKGPWVVAATLSLFLIVPAIVVTIALLLPEQDKDNDPFVWADRHAWPRTFYTAFKSLERPMMSSARTNEVYKDLGFHIEPGHQLAVIRCMTLAKQPREVFTFDNTRQQLEAEVAERPDLFYGQFLLATWHELAGDPEAAEPYYTAAFRDAPAVLMRHHVTPDGDSATDQPIDTLAFAADQIVDDQLDRSVVLVFPHLTTDEDGLVFLPVYKAILRTEDPALPPGVADLREKYQWFTFVGRIGRLPDVTISP
ncbi:MAG: hypothetical protein AAF911_11580 [Planctomycetota bacterium]